MHAGIRSILNLLLAAACLSGVALPSAVLAAGPIADLSITASITPGTFLPPGSVGSVTITITNNGPDPATDVVALSSQFLIGNGEQILLYQAQQSKCAVYYDSLDVPPGQPIPTFALLMFTGQTIPLGGSITCTVGISTYADATGTYMLNFRAVNDVAGWTDPDESNNETPDMALSVSPVGVPILSSFGLYLIIGLTMLFGITRLTIQTGENHAAAAGGGCIRHRVLRFLRGS